MKKILCLLVSLLFILSVLVFPASAAEGKSVIAFSANTVTIGGNVTVTATITAPARMDGLKFVLSYDADKLSFVSSSFADINANNAGKINIVDEPKAATKSYSFVFKSKATGGARIAVESPVASCIVENLPKDVDLNGGGATLNIKDVELPSNANLKSLSLSVGNISPVFNANRTNYTASVPFETQTIKVYANTADAKAKLALQKPNTLVVGANTITLTVTAQNGAQKSYKIVVTRRQQGENPPTTETPPTENQNPYEVNISGKNYEILQQIPVENVLKGFTLTTADFKGNQVQVIKDKSNTITAYFLKESGAEAVAPYTYNAELESFELLKYITVNDTVYLFTDFPEDTVMPSNYYSNFTQIGNFSVKSYLNIDTQLSDFSYVYCLVNGESGLYCYDSKEGTIQRAVNVHLMDVEASTTPERDDFLTRFNSLTTNGKVLLIAMLVAALCFVVLVIFLIIMAINKLFKKDIDIDQNDEFDFEDVIVVGDENAKND